MAGKTEWEDALIKHGIMAAPEVKDTDDEIQLKHIQKMSERDELADKNLDELDELEDDFESDIIEKYRAQRFKEMQEKQAKEKFGEVFHIGQTDFIREVSNASNENFVVVHLFHNSVPSCRIINAALDRLAARKRAVKFVKIIGSEAIKNWPESNCPAILVYSKTNIWRQFIGIGTLGGNSTNAEILEWILAENGVFETELEQDPRDKIQRMNIKRAGAGAAIRFGNRNNEDDEDDY